MILMKKLKEIKNQIKFEGLIDCANSWVNNMISVDPDFINKYKVEISEQDKQAAYICLFINHTIDPKFENDFKVYFKDNYKSFNKELVCQLLTPSVYKEYFRTSFGQSIYQDLDLFKDSLTLIQHPEIAIITFLDTFGSKETPEYIDAFITVLQTQKVSKKLLFDHYMLMRKYEDIARLAKCQKSFWELDSTITSAILRNIQ